jgi:hypothetical protein
MVSFIDEHRSQYGVEPICQQLPIAPSVYYEAKARQVDPARLPARVRREAALCEQIRQVHQANFSVYGARMVWRQLQQDNVITARCTVERLMRRLGLQGVIRGRRCRTTIAEDTASLPSDRVGRNFTAERTQSAVVG